MSQSMSLYASDMPSRRTPLPPLHPVEGSGGESAEVDKDEETAIKERRRWSSTDLAPRDASTPRLVALEGPLAGRVLALGTPLLFGRGPYNHVVLDDVRISRQHAKIAKELDGITLQDLGSANGTFVNDERIERRALAHGDIVRLGPFHFRFVVPSSTTPRISLTPPAPVLQELGHLGRLEDADRKLHALYGFVHAISPTLRPTELLDKIAESLLDVFPDADAAAVHVVDERAARMVVARVVGRDEPAPELVPPELDAAAPAVSERELCVPMRQDGAAIGALHLRARGGASFSDGDIDLLSALAVHGALTLAGARMHAESLARERLAKDLALAEQIQRSFLPMALPSLDGVTFAVDYEPAHAVGGDFYDVFPQGPGKIGVIVGDVSGKGVSAALLMARVSSDLRSAMQRDGSPAAALDTVNKSICRRNQHDIFVTAVCISIDVPTRTLTIASAGHLPPYIRRDRERDVVRVEGGASMPLGLFEDVEYGSVTLTLGPRDTLVLCTDGVTEATSELAVQFGFEGMERSLRTAGSSPTEICDRLLAAVRAHVGAAPQYDDLTLVVLGMEDAEAMAA